MRPAASARVNDALPDGLKWQRTYRYPTSTFAVFERLATDWEIVFQNFPATKNDVHAGIDLWALGHGTAAVFHMMRVLESGLEILASELQVGFANQNWQNVIEQIEAAIRLEQRTLPKGDARSKRLQFLSEAAKELVYFKDGWRNYVSHNKGAYDLDQANKVIDHTRQFMSTLAERLAEKRN